MQSFLGFCNFYRQFIRDYAHQAQPLYDACSLPRIPQHPTLVEAFQSLKASFLKPEYEQRPFPRKDRQGRLRLLAAPKGTNGQVTIHQDVRLYDAALGIHETLRYELPGDRYAWIQVLKGAIEINGKPLAQSDGAAVSEEDRLEIRATKAAEILLFDLA
jgi:redox-sensitive bicupin YhaK (pirin superfamily)